MSSASKRARSWTRAVAAPGYSSQSRERPSICSGCNRAPRPSWAKGSCLYAWCGTPDSTSIPTVGAITSAAGGAIAGPVTAGDFAPPSPIKNANITVCGADPCDPPNAYVVATGRSDDTGYYKVAFLGAGSYTVRIEPEYPSLQAVITHNVQGTAGGTPAPTPLLPPATRPGPPGSGPPPPRT